MQLDPRDLLSLIYTGATASQIATRLGVTYQRVTAMLRGSRIPAPLGPVIDAAYVEYLNAARQHASDSGVPFFAPLWFKRPTLRSGFLGDRLIVEHTQYISKTLRRAILANMVNTGRFVNASVRSMVDLKVYFKDAEDRFAESARSFRLNSEFHNREQLAQRLEQRIILHPIYTKYIGVGSQTPELIEQLLRERHEPSTGELPGTVLADAMLFQMRPPSNAEIRERIKQTRAIRRRQIRGRGNK